MHPDNIHKHSYDLPLLAQSFPELEKHIVTKPDNKLTIDFSNSEAVLALNNALLFVHYGVSNYSLPAGYLSPPIPSRIDYLLHIADLTGKENIRGLDIGTGANLIYPILGAAHFQWKMVGSELDEDSYAFAKALQKQLTWSNSNSKNLIECRLQTDRSKLFENIIKPNEKFDFVMCNPPFYSSEKEAIKKHQLKNKNLGLGENTSNFKGKSHELWCNGGEALFIKRMIKESVHFKSQVSLFTCLVSQKNNLPKLEKQLSKLKANYQVIPMNSGNKKTRFIAWSF